MISAFYVLHIPFNYGSPSELASYKCLISRRFTEVVPDDTSILSQFYQHLSRTPIHEQVPVLCIQNLSYVYIKCETNIVLLAVMHQNVNVMSVIAFLRSFQVIMIHFLCKGKVKTMDFELILDNSVLITELVDECLDFGVLQITDYKLLEEYIKVEPNFPKLLDDEDDSNNSGEEESDHDTKVKDKKKNSKSKPNTDIKSTHNQSIKTDVLENNANIINSSILRTYSSAINWRPKGIFYAKNEIFVDIIENVEFIYDLKTNTVKRNEIYGSCMVKSYLSGIPVCRMGFNENYMSSIENNDVSKNTDTEPLPENQMRIENIEEGESLLEGGEEDHEEKESKTSVAPSLDDLGGDAHSNHEEESEKSLENKVPKTTAKSFKHRIPIRNIQFHQCIELSKIYRDNIVTFIPPDDKFELMSYQVEQHKNKKKLPLISIKPVFKVIQKTKRLLVMCTLNTTFPRRRHCKSLLVRIPLNPYYFELGITDPNLMYKTESGEVSFKYDTMEIIWRIDSIDGKQTVRMMCELPLINCEQVSLEKISHHLLRKMDKVDLNGTTAQGDDEAADVRHDLEAFYGVNGKAITSTQKELLQEVKRNFQNDDIVLSFKIPMFTYSGLKLSYISVDEEQLKYPCFPWIRYLTQSSDLDGQHSPSIMGQNCTYRFKLSMDCFVVA
ncbi:Adaptor complexes medium subunit family protein [Candida parapsilosis]|uniref:Adaptor complexes medium subunit family protein n=1 Tax=Candida parapsilosis TaxID=5480 RepID=A0A8X7TED5_CANPA|nr:Adaptor complexes medium subunit family protein [Candida parapsilosis]KAF6056811.1 Adaptor complexes medium subunit family protein [Candida parapsilosis]KAF6059746.1 Adaptor complexes medium subunit family protein [Candida parapsilosis]KAF6068499.1 Adaptor complexes medium subunit family protein [Candida parapsilosis]KAI5902033.1 Adaptin medium chain APM2 [Candida parapsilosis]